MKTTLAFQPEFAKFDIHKGLAWIANEADWIGLRYVRETAHRRNVRNLLPELNSIAWERGVMVEQW